MSLTKTSKFLSMILRHKPEVANISLDEHGWADVSELIKQVSQTHEISFELLQEIVAADDKQRYSFNENKTKIRANQGHSINVDVELQPAIPPNVLYHGTGEKYVKNIEEKGLLAKSRLYVHLSGSIDIAVKVGSRHGNPVVYKIDCRSMVTDGYQFFLSKNKVWLTKSVPAKYFIR